MQVVCCSHILSRFQTSHLAPASSTGPLHRRRSCRSQAAPLAAAFTLRYDEWRDRLLLPKTTSRVATPEPTVCRVWTRTRFWIRVDGLSASRSRAVSSRPRGLLAISVNGVPTCGGFPTRRSSPGHVAGLRGPPKVKGHGFDESLKVLSVVKTCSIKTLSLIHI